VGYCHRPVHYPAVASCNGFRSFLGGFWWHCSSLADLWLLSAFHFRWRHVRPRREDLYAT
jgi:hypothetical protein